MKDIQRSAKLAYLLSTCHRFSNKAFIKLIQQYETSRVACSKYFYSIWITLDIHNKEFKLKNTYSVFLNSSKYLNDYEHRILEQLNTLTDAEKNNIKNNYAAGLGVSSSPEINAHCNKHLYTIINLINIYKNTYKYLFIPFTLDYSQDVGLVHQCALIIDLQKGEFIFYEPYLTFIKYECNYAEPIKHFLQIYKNSLPAHFIENNDIKYFTFDKYFNLKNGIQSIILEKNNNAGDFEKDVNILLDKTKEAFPELYADILEDINTDNNPVNTTDKTIKILNILSCFNEYDADTPEFNILFSEALSIYYLYNSKTCVTITFLELDVLFSSSNPENDLQNFHKEFDVNKPNEVLMKKLLEKIRRLFNIDIIDEKNKSNHLCAILSCKN